MSAETPLTSLPPELSAAIESDWRTLTEPLAQLPDSMQAQAAMVFACSRYALDQCLRHPDYLSERLTHAFDQAAVAKELQERCSACADLASLQKPLRDIRNREMVGIAWRDLAGLADIEAVLQETTDLAMLLTQSALNWVEQHMQGRFGQPRSRAGEPQRLVVLGMGKLGAGELNYSSDIDLIFLFPEGGQTDGDKCLDNGDFFIRFGKQLIKALGEVTADGFCYRVDMRLRPFGDSGPLAMHFGQAESYYESHGRDWERYALIKASPIAGDLEAGKEFLATLRPFIFRRYLDYNAFASLREMKSMINNEIERKQLHHNIKLGGGGIREIEFIAQAFQLLHGGRILALRRSQLLPTLSRIAELNMLPAQACDQLIGAYKLLRRAENRLQMVADQQTHDLPKDAFGQGQLSYALGDDNWQQTSQQLQQARAAVAEHFAAIFTSTEDKQDDNWDWPGLLDDPQTPAKLAAIGYAEAEAMVEHLRQLHGSANFRMLDQTGQERLSQLLPLVITAASETDTPDISWRRAMQVVEAISRRIAYFSLLIENPNALQQLIKLCQASPWMAEQLALWPALLDELIDARTLYALPTKAELSAELQQRLTCCDDDEEQMLDELRRFQHSAMLRVAAADINADLPLMNVSDRLTDLAEVTLAAALEQAWFQLEAKHGRPMYKDADGSLQCAEMMVIAYGKMGGIELGYGSDLDVVFLHSSPSGSAVTDGNRPIDHLTFFARLGQRVIHWLSSRTGAGRAYEIDTRLRPSGASGALVSTIAGFEKYQQNSAWNWEHQALVRARPVAGSAGLAQAFDAIRQKILSKNRDENALRDEVVSMRNKMRQQLDQTNSKHFDLKQGVGGITDIEFMVQYAVLRWSAAAPELLRWTDNIRLLETLAQTGHLPNADAVALAEAYRQLRAQIHRLRLQEQPALVPADALLNHRQAVAQQWLRWFPD